MAPLEPATRLESIQERAAGSTDGGAVGISDLKIESMEDSIILILVPIDPFAWSILIKTFAVADHR